MKFGTKLVHKEYTLKRVWCSIYETNTNQPEWLTTTSGWQPQPGQSQQQEHGGSGYSRVKCMMRSEKKRIIQHRRLQKSGDNLVTSLTRDIQEMPLRRSWNAKWRHVGCEKMDDVGWKGRLSTAGSPWPPRSGPGEVFLIYVGFLIIRWSGEKHQVKVKTIEYLPPPLSAVCLPAVP